MIMLLMSLATLVPGVAVGVVALLFALHALVVEVGQPTTTQLFAIGLCVWAIPATVFLASALLDRFCAEQAPPTTFRRLGSLGGLVMLFAFVPLSQLLQLILAPLPPEITVTQLLQLIGQVVAAAAITAALLQLLWAAPTLVFAWLLRREPLAHSALLGMRALRPLVLLVGIAFTSQLLLGFILHEVGPTAVRTTLEGS